MDLAQKANRLRRFRDIGLLLWKYGQADLIHNMGLDDLLWSNQSQAERDKVLTTQKRSLELRGEEFADDLEKLGPTYIRLGQLLALRPDLLPLPYIQALKDVGTNTPAMKKVEVEKVFQSDTGCSITQAFRSIDYQPLSISVFGQTHKATTVEGKPVIVKVQRPHARHQVQEELDELGELADFFDQHTRAGKMINFRATLEEFRKIILTELDYRQELHNLKVLKGNLKDLDQIVVPAPVEKYSTARILIIEYLEGTALNTAEPFGLLASERATLAAQLFHAYLKQLLVDGFVHADPDPQNVLFTNVGKLALLDVGFVTRISKQMQEKFLHLLVALNEGRAENVANFLLNMAEKREDCDEAGFRRTVEDLVLVHRDRVDDRLEVGRVFLGIAQSAVKYDLTLPPEIAILSNTLVSLDKISDVIDRTFDSRKYIQDHVSEIMRGHVMRTLTPAHIFQNLMDAAELIEQVPLKISRILDAVANNELKVTVNAIDEKVLISGFQKIANRITIGLVLASLIIGAAMLMHVKTSFTIWGYPGLAILCFMAAAGCGFALVLEVLIGDRRSARS